MCPSNLDNCACCLRETAGPALVCYVRGSAPVRMREVAGAPGNLNNCAFCLREAAGPALVCLSAARRQCACARLTAESMRRLGC